MNAMVAQKIATDFWAYINNQEWDKAQSLLSSSFSADWPQSKEKITTPEISSASTATTLVNTQ